MEEKTITLEDVCLECEKYHDGQIDQTEFKEFMDQIIIYPYLPLSDKFVCISNLLFKYEMDASDNLEWQIGALEQNKLWYVLLKYTNIVTDGYETYQNVGNYDLLCSTIGDIIMLGCFNDYNRTIKMFDDLVNVYNIQSLLSIFENFDEETLKKSSEELQKQLEHLDEKNDMISNLSKIILKQNI